MSTPDDINYDLSLIIYDLLPTNDKPKFVYAIDKNWFYQYHIEKEQKRTTELSKVINFMSDGVELLLFDMINEAYSNNESTILKMIDKFKDNIDPTIVNKDGYTLLLLACQHELSKTSLKLIEEFGDKCVPGHINRFGNTALIWACYNQLSKVALKLIETFGYKCVPNHIDDEGETALSIAKEYNVIDVISKLEELKIES